MAKKPRNNRTGSKSRTPARPRGRTRPPVPIIGLGIIVIVGVAAIAYLLWGDRLSGSGSDMLMLKNEGEIVFVSAAGDSLTRIEIEIADDQFERRAGLMYRHQPKDDQGLLFVFDTLRIQSFWMRNTIYSLDMLFVDSSLEIVTILKETKPFSQSPCSSTRPALYVVEVEAGFADRHNIVEGDRMLWRRYDDSLDRQ